jgi:transcriptional regulator with XRE-family HTH domain
MTGLIKKFEMVERVHHLIRKRATGTPEELAEKLGVSPATVFRIIEGMKSLEAPIVYDFTICSYYYEYPVEFNFGFKSPKDWSEINGGYVSSSNFFKNNFALSIFESAMF